MARDKRLDGLKGCLIFLVVLGHLSFNDYGLQVHRMIYSFHMPAFVFLSGFFTSRSYNPEKSRRWALDIFILYVIAQVLHTALDVAMHQPISPMRLISPHYTLWYLPCLIIWRFSIWKVFNRINDTWLLVISASLSVLSGFIPIDTAFAFQRLFAFFPFFVLGFVYRTHHWQDTIDKTPGWIALALFIFGLLISRLFPGFMPKFHYTSSTDLILRIAQSGLGCMLCMCIMRLINAPVIFMFNKIGFYTLWIYIGHSFLTRINIIERVQMRYWNVSSNLFEAILICSLYCIGISVAARFLTKRINEGRTGTELHT